MSGELCGFESEVFKGTDKTSGEGRGIRDALAAYLRSGGALVRSRGSRRDGHGEGGESKMDESRESGGELHVLSKENQGSLRGRAFSEFSMRSFE